MPKNYEILRLKMENLDIPQDKIDEIIDSLILDEKKDEEILDDSKEKKIGELDKKISELPKSEWQKRSKLVAEKIKDGLELW